MNFRFRLGFHARWLLLITLLLTLALANSIGAAPSAPNAVDLSVTGIEVTQAIQTTTNSITLVAQRSTAVRATIGVSGTGAPVATVTGKLHVFVNGTAITPAAGLSPINAPLTAPLIPQRSNANDTLNFELLAPTGIPASTDVDFRVDITPVAGETNTANNSGSVNDLTFVARTNPALYFTRINFTPSGLGLPALTDVQAGRGDAFVRGIYPVNDGDANLYRPGLFPTLTYSQDDNSNNILNISTEGNNLLSFLASCRQLIVDGGLGASNNTFLYGWIAGNPIEGNGLGQVSGFNAYGNTQDVRYQRTYAHELGHNFGLNHNSRMLDQVGWDVGARLPNNPAANNTTGRVKPMTLFDIMVGGQLTNSAWVDTITYNFFLGSPILTAPDADLFSEAVVVIQGIFDPSGQELVYLEPVFRFPWPSQPTPREQEGSFVAEVIDEQQNVYIAQFEALVGDDSGDEEQEEQFGFFEVMVPVDPDLDIMSVRITDLSGEVTFGDFEPSEPPQISVIAPEEGGELGELTEVSWEIDDPDTPPEDLLLQLVYSPDAGRTWVPIAVDVPGTEMSIFFDSTEIQESSGEGIIRVFVSDGLNTDFAEVTGLTTLAAQYPTPDQLISSYLPIVMQNFPQP